MNYKTIFIFVMIILENIVKYKQSKIKIYKYDRNYNLAFY